MKKTMIVVADSVRARVFTWGDDRTQLQELEDITNPEGRLHDRDMSSDLPGKQNGASGAGGHGYEGKSSPKAHEITQFAKRIADYLDDARKANKLSRLLLIVAPAFLGELRSQFADELNKLVAFELSKNLVTHDVSDILKNIPKSSEFRKV